MDDSQITLSVLITTYNSGKYIKKTLDSVLYQNLRVSYEILVGDDNSTDNTVKIVKTYCCNTNGIVKLFSISKENTENEPAIVKASKNRIFIAQHAKGKYVVFLDSDDFLINPDSLQKKIDILEDSTNFDCVMCGSNFNFYYEDNDLCVPAISYAIKRTKFNNKTYWRSGLWIPAEAYVIRNIINFHKLETEYVNTKLFDDNLITFSYLKHGNIYFLNSLDVNYRIKKTGFLNQELAYQVFVNMLLYTQASYFINPFNQNLRLYNVISKLHHGKVKIGTNLISTIYQYGEPAQKATEYIDFWQNSNNKRTLKWLYNSVLYYVYSFYKVLYFYGIQGLLSKLMDRIIKDS